MSEESPLSVLAGIAAELIPDAGIAESRAIGSTDPLLRRSYVRAVFALVEGLNFARLRVSTESEHLPPAALRKADIAVRVEKRALKGSHEGSIPSSTRTAVAAFAAAHQIPNPLAPLPEGWQAFVDAVAVRNRITHPCSGADCRVSDADFKLVQMAHHWYQELQMQLLESARQHGKHGA